MTRNMPTEEIIKQEPEIIYVASQNQEVDWSLIGNFVLILITVIGWIIVYRLNLKQQKENLKDNLRVKVYEEFWEFRTDFQKNILSVNEPPFILMKPVRISGLKYNELEEKQKSIKYFQKYLDELINSKREFTDVFMNFWRSLEMWIFLMPELEKAKNDLTREYRGLNKKLDEYIDYLQKLDKYKWEEWDQDDIKNRNKDSSGEVFNLYCYIDDMMFLIREELVNPLFDVQKQIRNPIGKGNCVLTKEGLVYKTNKEE